MPTIHSQTNRNRSSNSSRCIALLFILICVFWLSDRLHVAEEEDVAVADIVIKSKEASGSSGIKSSSSATSYVTDDGDDDDDDGIEDDVLVADSEDEEDIDDDTNDTSINAKEQTNNQSDKTTTTTTTSSISTSTSNSNDKTHLLNILRSANVTITPELEESLPTWADITALYGSEPILRGLDKCADFRNSVPKHEAYLGIAGLENTGTNLLHRLLYESCVIPERWDKYVNMERWKQKRVNKWERNGILPEVPWGKHKPLSKRGINCNSRGCGTIDVDHVLPVVIVKDPFTWMQSMCRHPYKVLWKRTKKQHCPNLMPIEADLDFDKVSKLKGVDIHPNEPIPVKTVLSISPYVEQGTPREPHREHIVYESLVDFWNKWYAQYFEESSFPVLMVRFEDLLYHSDTVVKQACECVGGQMKSGNVHMQADPLKTGMLHNFHGAQSGLIESLKRYGSSSQRINNYTVADLEYAGRTIRKDIFDEFGYNMP